MRSETDAVAAADAAADADAAASIPELVAAFHDRQVLERDWPMLSHVQAASRPWQAIDANHRYNGLLWREDERARRLDLPAHDIAAGKRLIDRYNGRRHDAIEALDDALLAGLARVTAQPGARLSSETPGAMIDRLSILALQIHHMRVQARRPDLDDLHLQACTARLARLAAQRADLLCCLDGLLRDARAGRACFKRYRQCKMDNDPALRPICTGA